jgi:regulator of RNase E activity RraA
MLEHRKSGLGVMTEQNFAEQIPERHSRHNLDDDLRKLLQQTSTATVATLLFQRGLRNQSIQGAQRISRAPLQLLGPAFTIRCIPSREDIDVPSSFRDPNHPQRLSIEQIPAGSVLVMDCRGDRRSAAAGDILMKRLEVRGCAGVVTDGALRDCDAIADINMAVFCGGRSALSSLTRHHAVDFEVPIACGDAPVYPGDVVLGDGDGVIIIPREIVADIARGAAEKDRLEIFLHEQVAGGAALPGTYPPDEAMLSRYQNWVRDRF